MKMNTHSLFTLHRDDCGVSTQFVGMHTRNKNNRAKCANEDTHK